MRKTRVKESEEYRLAMKNAADISHELMSTMTENQQELFRKLMLNEMQIHSEIALMNYLKGFEEGLRIGVKHF